MKTIEIHVQQICGNCLQLLVNDESEHTEKELNEFHSVLERWRKELNYIPLGLTDNNEPYFTGQKCDLCDALPSHVYEYNFGIVE